MKYDKISLRKQISRTEPHLPFDDMINFYLKRTSEHIDRVRKNCDRILKVFPKYTELKMRGENHDLSKYHKPEYVPYIWMTWWYKCKNEGTTFLYPPGMEKRIDRAVEHHYSKNRHHPEFHSNNTGKMTTIDICEMIADHAAMSQEFNNSLLKWTKEKTFKDYTWSIKQQKLILKLVSIFE